MAEPIISVSGLRGIIGTELTPDVVSKYMAAFCTTLTKGVVILGRDGRSSGSMLVASAKSTLLAHGMNVLDAGAAATPTIGFAVRHHKAVAGVQVSASHNPIEYNGLKLFNHDGRVLPGHAGEKVLAKYRSKEAAWVSVHNIGQEIRSDGIHEPHVDCVLKTVDVEAIRDRNFKVLLDSNHGAGSIAGKMLLERLGCTFTVVGDTPDGSFAHKPEPTAENLQSITKHVVGGKYDIGYCQDPDADRVAIIDENGNYIGEEFSAVLCMLSRMMRQPGPLVTNCASSSMTQWLAEKYQVPFHRSKVGEANVVDKMIEVNAIYGGEGSGGPIDPSVGFIRDSIVAIAQILDLMTKESKSISQIVSTFPRKIMIKDKMTLDVSKLPIVNDKLPAAMSAPKTDLQDGIRLDWSDRWLLLRGSNTEPIVRLICEADSIEQAQQLIDQAKSVIQQLI